MWNEGSAVSYRAYTIPSRPGIVQINNTYYWKGAVVTHGISNKGPLIEIQKDNYESLNELIQRLEKEMEVKFKKRTLSRD